MTETETAGCTAANPPGIKRYTLAEWQAEFEHLLGVKDPSADDVRRITFVCPRCEETHSVGEFADHLEAQGKLSGWDPSDAAQKCYHRFVADGVCDWCAFGLFKTLGKGAVIVHPDGHETDVFAFGAPLPPAVAR